MRTYHDLLEDVLINGTRKEDRTGTGTLSVFGRQLRFDLSAGFPAVTTKKLFWKGVVAELLWFLKGSTNVKWLQEQGVQIWDEWADGNGDLGPVYGKQWRNWEFKSQTRKGIPYTGAIDQIAQVIQTIRTNPNSRRMLVSAWNVGDLGEMALEPCHVMFQFYVTPAQVCEVCSGTGSVTSYMNGRDNVHPCPRGCDPANSPKGKLSLQMYQRSADLFLGVPFNIASYALLTHMIAQVCDLDVGEYVHTFGDTHIYLNHAKQVKQQLLREPRPLPTLWLNPEIKDIDSFKIEDCKLVGYDPHPKIEAPVAI